MKFNKPPLDYVQQLDQLIQRGLICTDRGRALHYLAHLNYYRLGAYWLPFEADHTKHIFRSGSRFDDVLNLYIFDRELRLMALDAIERVEVSVRGQWAYILAHRYGPHAHMDASLFRQQWDHAEQCKRLETDARNGYEAFLKHYYSKYDEPLPPLWTAVEIMSLGQFSKWYSNLRHSADRNTLARCYDMDESILASFLHHLCIIRNICAHHGRLWNRAFTFTFRLPAKRPQKLLTSFNRERESSRNLYNTLVMLAWLLDCIAPQHRWRERLISLLDRHAIPVATMGFPVGWRQLPIWLKEASDDANPNSAAPKPAPVG